MHADPLMPIFVTLTLAILVSGMIMRRLHQPYVVTYLIVGMIFGPYGLGYISQTQSLFQLSDIGVTLLLFFVGMEISPKAIISRWKIPVVGTVMQVVITIGLLAVMSHWTGWSMTGVVFLGFVISLSSTAVVIKLLEEWNETQSGIGQNVIGILLVQDLLFIPMIMCLDLLGGETWSPFVIFTQFTGAAFFLLIFRHLVISENFILPFIKKLGDDHETQVFIAFMLCFGMSILSYFFHLSTALGAFIAGMIVAASQETKWAYKNLLSLKTLFVAVFFISIGMLINFHYVMQNFKIILSLVLLSLSLNTIINCTILRFLGESLGLSLYGGLLLSQLGEFSFVLASIGHAHNIVSNDVYNLMITVIALSLLLSPLWIKVFKLIMSHLKIKDANLDHQK